MRPPSPLADLAASVLAGAPAPGRVLLVAATGEVVDVELHATGVGVLVLHREVGPPAGLTVRELQVLDGVGHGLSNPEIGARLGIGARTVARAVTQRMRMFSECRASAWPYGHPVSATVRR